MYTVHCTVLVYSVVRWLDNRGVILIIIMYTWKIQRKRIKKNETKIKRKWNENETKIKRKLKEN